MKTTDRIYSIAIVVVILAIIGVVIYKFAVPGKPDVGAFDIKEFEKMIVLDLDGSEVRLADLAAKDEITYCFIFELSNCYSCIFQGIEDLKRLKNAGKSCLGLAVHHMIDEISGWSANYDFSPFFMLKKENFYEHIRTPVMPVMVQIKNGKIVGFRYIRP